MQPGDLYLGRFPFGGRAGLKLRPVLLLTGPLGPVPEVLTAYISSAIPTILLPTDLLLDARQPVYASTKLPKVSVLRLHKLATIHERDCLRSIGALSPAAMQEVERRLRSLLGL